MHQKGPVSVLIAPLDWGLGHATRCIPIIKELVKQGAQVQIAAGGAQKKLLTLEFPRLAFLEIPGYEMRYHSGVLLKWGLIFRIPAILKQIKRENEWLKKTLRDRKIDAVISDNRYGLFHKDLFCVFMTHQLSIQSGFGPPGSVYHSRFSVRAFMNRILQKWNYKFISNFSCCWVPDSKNGFSVAGLLSHPSVMPPVPIEYIGILSRFQLQENRTAKNSLLILLSGPEPQRTRFENILFSRLPDSSRQIVVVRGLPGDDHPIPFVRDGIKIFNHLLSDELNTLMAESETIIARSGYSTIMDLLTLRKNAILVPTPGQTEQEYLGWYLHGRKWMYCVSQKNFNLEKAIHGFKNGGLELPGVPGPMLEKVIHDFLKKISRRD